MISLAERRGRSALGHYDLPASALTTTISSAGGPRSHGRRQQSAPARATATAAVLDPGSVSPRPPSPLLQQLTSQASTAPITLPDIVTDRIRALDHAFARLQEGVHDVVADDADWLEAQYGVGRRLGAVHAEHKALIGLLIDLHEDLHEWRRRSEQSAAQHDQQHQILHALEFPLWTNPDQLQKTITSLERELHRLDPGRCLDPIDTRLNSLGPIPRLIALRFQRQDDLLYVMRRRLAQMSLDQPLSQCLDQFRSLRALLDELDRLRQRNAQLRLRERRFQPSVLLRRRPLQRCSSPLLQTLVIALQNELSAVHDLVAALQPDRHPLRDLLTGEAIACIRPVKDAAIDLDALYAQLTGTRSPDPGPIDDDPPPEQTTPAPGRRSVSRSSLQQLRDAVRMADFVSETASKAAQGAFADLEQDLDLMQTTIGEQQELITDLSDRLRRQQVLNLKLTTITYELLRRSDPGADRRRPEDGSVPA